MEKKPLFIHIPKTGGLALGRHVHKKHINTIQMVGEALVKELPTDTKQAVKETIRLPVGAHHGYHHLRYRDIECAEVDGVYQPFAIVRNPWARVYSFWTYFHTQIRRSGPLISLTRVSIPQTFEEFVLDRIHYRPEAYKANWLFSIRNWVVQSEYVIDAAGYLSADILRFEHYAEDLKAYTGIEGVKTFNNTGHRFPSYQEAYEPHLIQAVADWYKADIDMFGFDFDTSATKNIWSS